MLIKNIVHPDHILFSARLNFPIFITTLDIVYLLIDNPKVHNMLKI